MRACQTCLLPNRAFPRRPARLASSRLSFLPGLSQELHLKSPRRGALSGQNSAAGARVSHTTAPGGMSRKMTMPTWPVRFDGVPSEVKSAPLLGEHTEEVLADWLGLDAAAVAGLRQDGIV